MALFALYPFDYNTPLVSVYLGFQSCNDFWFDKYPGSI